MLSAPVVLSLALPLFVISDSIAGTNTIGFVSLKLLSAACRPVPTPTVRRRRTDDDAHLTDGRTHTRAR